MYFNFFFFLVILMFSSSLLFYIFNNLCFLLTPLKNNPRVATGFGTIFGGVYKGSFRIDFLGFGSYFSVCFFFFWLYFLVIFIEVLGIFLCWFFGFLVGVLCDCNGFFFLGFKYDLQRTIWWCLWGFCRRVFG